MTVIRRLEVKNFRSIKHLIWHPSPDFNCLIGPGDNGKTSILDAIDLCLTARRHVQFTDADFHNLEVDNRILIELVLGDLDDELASETYGHFLRGYNVNEKELEEECGSGLEEALLLSLSVADDLEPVWQLRSQRADDKGLEIGLRWKDREAISPVRIGVAGDSNLSWRHGSLLNKLTHDKLNASKALAVAAREARTAFGKHSQDELSGTLKAINEAASALGVDLGGEASAMLDTHASSFGSGTVSVHSEAGIPARSLGLGSKRLLLAGIQSRAASVSPIALVDEIEIGLEPHRIISLLQELGSKSEGNGQQVFATSHSPVVLTNLTCGQLKVVRRISGDAKHEIHSLDQSLAGALKTSPGAFLGKKLMFCEGKTEANFIRGLDAFASTQPISRRKTSIHASGTYLFDCKGGGPGKIVGIPTPYMKLGYESAIFMDNDKPIPEAESKIFTSSGGRLFHWSEAHSIEYALFYAASPELIGMLLIALKGIVGEAQMNNDLRDASPVSRTIQSVLEALTSGQLSQDERNIIAKASGGKKDSNSSKGWLKEADNMEVIARDVIAPNFQMLDRGFTKFVSELFTWMRS